MAEQPVSSLSQARERKIDELSTHFANDDLTLEELERRIEQVYKAGSLAELETITADLRRALTVPADHTRVNVAPSVASVPDLKSARLLALMSQTRRVGRWTMPPQLRVVAIMSDTRIDFREAMLMSRTVVLELRSVMAQVVIVVPPGMRVVLETSSVMSNVRNRADDLPTSELPASMTAPVLRLGGFALMSDVSVVVRRPGDPPLEDEE